MNSDPFCLAGNALEIRYPVSLLIRQQKRGDQTEFLLRLDPGPLEAPAKLEWLLPYELLYKPSPVQEMLAGYPNRKGAGRSKDERSLSQRLQTMKALGRNWFHQLLPQDLKQFFLDNESAIGTLTIDSNETTMPWEWLVLQAPNQEEESLFFCEAFATTRSGWPNLRSRTKFPLKKIAIVTNDPRWVQTLCEGLKNDGPIEIESLTPEESSTRGNLYDGLIIPWLVPTVPNLKNYGAPFLPWIKLKPHALLLLFPFSKNGAYWPDAIPTHPHFPFKASPGALIAPCRALPETFAGQFCIHLIRNLLKEMPIAESARKTRRQLKHLFPEWTLTPLLFGQGDSTYYQGNPDPFSSAKTLPLPTQRPTSKINDPQDVSWQALLAQSLTSLKHSMHVLVRGAATLITAALALIFLGYLSQVAREAYLGIHHLDYSILDHAKTGCWLLAHMLIAAITALLINHFPWKSWIICLIALMATCLLLFRIKKLSRSVRYCLSTLIWAICLLNLNYLTISLQAKVFSTKLRDIGLNNAPDSTQRMSDRIAHTTYHWQSSNLPKYATWRRIPLGMLFFLMASISVMTLMHLREKRSHMKTVCLAFWGLLFLLTVPRLPMAYAFSRWGAFYPEIPVNDCLLQHLPDLAKPGLFDISGSAKTWVLFNNHTWEVYLLNPNHPARGCGISAKRPKSVIAPRPTAKDGP